MLSWSGFVLDLRSEHLAPSVSAREAGVKGKICLSKWYTSWAVVPNWIMLQKFGRHAWICDLIRLYWNDVVPVLLTLKIILQLSWYLKFSWSRTHWNEIIASQSSLYYKNSKWFWRVVCKHEIIPFKGLKNQMANKMNPKNIFSKCNAVFFS